MKSWKEYSLKKAPKNFLKIPVTIVTGSRTIAPDEIAPQSEKLKLTQTLTLTRGQFYSGQLSVCPQP